MSSLGLAIGLAIEGFKKPKNPATQLLKGEFAADNKKVETLIADWGLSAVYATLLFFLVLGYSYLRNDVATRLDDRAYLQIEEQAQDVARLPKKSANENGVQKYVRDVKKKATEIKKAEKVYLVNSALEMVKKISESLPARSSLTFEVQKLEVLDHKVVVQGAVASPAGLAQIVTGLKSIATGQNVKPIQADGVTLVAGETAFAFEFDVDRGLTK
jgi:general secretion pathway protein L